MGLQPVIAPSAHRHGISVADMVHAYDNPIRIFEQDDEMTMTIGPGWNAALLEVGHVTADDGRVVILHADHARTKYTKRLRK